MANDKGHLDCTYCAHVKNRARKYCALHEMDLPARQRHENLICANFEPSDAYWATNHKLVTPPPVRFSWFHKDISAGLLYSFPYQNPEAAVPIFDLRTGRVVDDPNNPPFGWFVPKSKP